MDLTQKVNVRCSLPLACPLVLFEKTSIENLGLISLLCQNELRGETKKEGEGERRAGGRKGSEWNGGRGRDGEEKPERESDSV